jgi:nicotinic acid phosphoribosyltransferase
MDLLLHTDFYKINHGSQYPKGTTKVYSYLCARKERDRILENSGMMKVVYEGVIN